MKKIIISLAIVLLAVMPGCDDDPSGPQMGCLTGVNKSTGVRGLIRCCTKQEFLAGSNVNYGGTSNWDVFTQHQWKAVGNCNDCQ